jgi:hypothetical protein
MINIGLSNNNVQLKHSSSSNNNSFDDFLMRIRDGVVSSFQQRCTLYDVDIRRLDSLRGSPQLDFQQLFLVKESLALMYQMMQLPSEALIQYEELEALLSFVPAGLLPDTFWVSYFNTFQLTLTHSRTHALALSHSLTNFLTCSLTHTTHSHSLTHSHSHLTLHFTNYLKLTKILTN